MQVRADDVVHFLGQKGLAADAHGLAYEEVGEEHGEHGPQRSQDGRRWCTLPQWKGVPVAGPIPYLLLNAKILYFLES